MSLTELELAQRIRDGTAPSPVKFSNMWLVNLRITGTGLAYRSGLNEHVWRDPKIYLNPEFLERCNGLPVIENHPGDAVLNEEEFAQRIVGSVMLPYVNGDEVWAVCRVYKEELVNQIMKGEVSTSPSVVFNSQSGNAEVQDGDANFLIEGTPFLIDHIALVTADHGSLGVWDKDRIPAGIEVSNTEEGLAMNEEQLQALIAKVTQGVMTGITPKMDAVTARMDSLEQGIKARADEAAAAEEKRRADEAEEKAKADQLEAEEKAKADALEAEEKAKADAAAAEEKAAADAAAAEEEKAKNDSDMGTAYAKADSAFTNAGKTAPMPFAGEKAMDYRKRALISMQSHSPAHKDVNIRAIADSATLSVLEEAIYGAAKSAIDNEMKNTSGTLHKRVRSDEAGRRITEYQGDPNVWLAAFKTPSRTMVPGSLNKGH